ncbi:transcriptional regulator [bacterium endosymbiont of Escarpia laminata]|nr:MAG: transcriptional regulator [bacterium endosymbiont of Escarpia laminata]
MNIVFGLFDPELDGCDPSDRLNHWRPTVSLLSHVDLPVSRLELLVQRAHLEMAQAAIAEMAACSPETHIVRHDIHFQDPWDFEEVFAVLHDVVDDYPFDPDKVDYFAHMSAGTHVARICLFLLCESRLLPGRMLQTYPADAYGQGTEAGWRTIDLTLARYDRLAQRFERRKARGEQFLKSGIATENPAFNRMIDEIETVAIASQHPILLTGPTGAGKSVLAHRIYELKHQRHQLTGAFVPVNCATLRGDAAMSTLFGHCKGAFTGAVSVREGLLKTADQGLLFLDEIGELGPEEQAMLLTALEKGHFYPIGSDSEASSDFQLIAGSNRDLRTEVRAGRFREDLLARINLWHFDLPGLRERSEDITPNIVFELDKFASRNGRQVSFNREAMRRYLDFAHSPSAIWRGNFRDLNASVTRMSTLAGGGRIDTQIVEREISRLEWSWIREQPVASESFLGTLLPSDTIDKLDLFDRLQLEQVAKVCLECASLSEAGRRLFGVSRTHKTSINDSDRLRKYLARFGLDWGAIHSGQHS